MSAYKSLPKYLCFLWVFIVFLPIYPCQSKNSSSTLSYQIIREEEISPLVITVWIKEDNVRIETAIDSSREKGLIIQNEDGVFTYKPRENVIYKYPINDIRALFFGDDPLNYILGVSGVDLRRWFGEMIQGKSKPVGEDMIDGKVCDVYNFYPQNNVGKVWVWQDKEFPLKVIFHISAMTGEKEYRFRNVKFGEDVSDDMFQLPSGIPIKQMFSP